MDQAEIGGSVKCMVMHIRDYLESSQPKPSYTKISAAEESGIQKKSAVTTTAGPVSTTSKGLEAYPIVADVLPSFPRTTSAQPPSRSEDFNSLSAISLSGSITSSLKEKTIQEAKTIKQKYHSMKSSGKQSNMPNLGLGPEQSNKMHSLGGVFLQLSEKKRDQRKSIVSSLEKRQGTHKSSRDATLSAQARKFGIAVLQLGLMPLLAGERYLASQLAEKSPKLLDAYLGFSVESPLMTEKQKRELNPLIIRIHSARCLPTTPVPIKVLQNSCAPVYCKYKFHNFPPHQTCGRDHGTEVFFKDLNVILLGSINSEELHEYLRGPPLEIEVHDRDKKIEAIKTKPSLFGEEPGDSKLSNLSIVTSRYMVQNPITGTEEIWHPHGIAKINLTELLLGEKNFNFYTPIHNCPVQDASIYQGENTAQKTGGADSNELLRFPVGDYINSESYLKVRIELSAPLSPKDDISDAEDVYCPYGCMIYVFDYKNTSLLSYLLQEITEINAEALQLEGYPLHIIQKSLNTLKLNHKLTLEEISQMDIITGFHIVDGSIHLLVVEGLKEKALKRLWNRRINRIKEAKMGRLQILYNSHISFHQRLYVDLEAMLFHIHLCKPLSSIMKQSLLYIREMVPQACFQALTRLDYICRSTKLRDVVHYDLLPSAEMIMMLSQEFGLPLTMDELLLQQCPEISHIYKVPPKYIHMKQDKHFRLDNHNEEYVLRKREMESQLPEDYIQANIVNVDLLSKMIRRKAAKTIRAFPSDFKSVFNYSSQSLNSAEIAKKLLREKMAQEPEKRFAHNHQYLSGMFDPVDEDIALKKSIEQSKEMWLSSKGFVFPGFKSSVECNMHPRMPDEARQLELTEKWQENLLNTSQLKPVLDRDRWSWDKRNVDFELYKKLPEPIVVLDTSREEPEKDVRCNTALKVHRCCLETELIASGPKASCQLARLQGLLKDKPAKLSLKLQPSPDVGFLDEVGGENICRGFVPGIEADHSLKWNGNIIPCHNREHNVFKTLKGADFRLFTRSNSFHYKRWPSRKWPLNQTAE
ncbi:uncharacterized protein CFAP92 isoform X2 [Hemicordylus capensis]|nr:uncharacterized protein CFAP92 isoform X2 [Hemicordylus capensis]